MNMFPPKDKPVFDTHGVEPGMVKHLLTMMLKIRAFEEKIAELVDQKRVRTPCHLYIGQEATATGVCAALEREDYVFGNHRSHGHYLAKGGDLRKGMAEIFCRETGCSRGRGGSMHLCAPEVGILGTSSIVSGSVPIAVGAALAESIRGSGRLSVIFHGDGVPEEGAWNEAANFAAINKLPILFVCENNLYCTHQPLEERRLRDNLPELARAHGLESVSVDGNNVVEVYRRTREIARKVRDGEGPFFLECRTYRWLGHVGPRDNLEVGLRSEDEIGAWKERCPIGTFSRWLVDSGTFTQEKIERLRDEVASKVESAVEFAEQSVSPGAEEVLENVFMTQGRHS